MLLSLRDIDYDTLMPHACAIAPLHADICRHVTRSYAPLIAHDVFVNIRIRGACHVIAAYAAAADVTPRCRAQAICCCRFMLMPPRRATAHMPREWWCSGAELYCCLRCRLMPRAADTSRVCC